MRQRQRISEQMLDILALLAKEGGRFEWEFIGDLPKGVGLFGNVFTPFNLYHSRYASVSRSLRRLRRMGLVQRSYRGVRDETVSRGYLTQRLWWLTEKGGLMVKQRCLTDRDLETVKPWLLAKKTALTKELEEFQRALSESRRREV